MVEEILPPPPRSEVPESDAPEKGRWLSRPGDEIDDPKRKLSEVRRLASRLAEASSSLFSARLYMSLIC